jgi:glycerol uptake facilitator protein
MAAPPTTPQKLAAEFLGTAFLVFVGAGSAAATGVLSAAHGVPFSMAQLGVISFAFMLVIVGAVYAIGHISGGHINPAVTLALAISGKFGWREVPGYIAAQVVGAIAGAAAIFLTLGRVATVAAGGGVTASPWLATCTPGRPGHSPWPRAGSPRRSASPRAATPPTPRACSA